MREHPRSSDPDFVPYANGVTYVGYCIASEGCDADATEMVGPRSLCAAHAEKERAERAKSKAWSDAWAASPEGKAEMRREQAWEAQVS